MTDQINNPKVNSSLKPVLIIGALFFVFGFITWLNSVLIPYLKIACELNNFESYLVAFSFYISYFVMAIPSGIILRKTGFKKGMALGLLIIGIGAIVFIPAAMSRMYALFLLGLFIQGTGLAILQTASNPYITILGSPESAAKRISIMGIFNKVAGAIAPVVLGAVALKDADSISSRLVNMNLADKTAELNALASRVILPYIIIFIVLFVLAAFLSFSTLPEIDTDQEDEYLAQANADKASVLQFPHLLLGVLALFLYMGAEVIAGDTIISYGASQDISLSTAKFFTTATLLSMVLGYIIGIICIPKYLSQQTALKCCALLGIIFSLAAIYTSGYISVAFIALLGLANSLVWPAIWPLALSGLGRFTKTGSSLLIMGVAGGALIPLAYGRLADLTGTREAYWIMIPCYLFIGYYAAYGYKVKRVKNL